MQYYPLVENNCLVSYAGMSTYLQAADIRIKDDQSEVKQTVMQQPRKSVWYWCLYDKGDSCYYCWCEIVYHGTAIGHFGAGDQGIQCWCGYVINTYH